MGNNNNNNNNNNNTSFPAPFPLSLLLLLVLVLLLVPSLVLGRVAGGFQSLDEEEEEGHEKILEPVMGAAERAVDFFAQDYSSINLDGLFGMRVAQGHLQEALKECKSGGSCPQVLQRRLQAVLKKIETAAEAALSYVEAEDGEYFGRFLQVIDRPLLVPYRAQTLRDLAKTPPGTDPSYGEEMGDACMARIMGTFREDSTGQMVEKCNVTQSCWTMMTREGTCKYAVTHQLIYFSFIEKQGCTDQVEAAMKAKVAQSQERMCGSIYNEAAEEVKDNKVPDIFQDLFLEQVMVCGTLGFENFLRTDWMRMVLTWQKTSGCFSVNNAMMLQTEEQLIKARGEERQLMRDLQLEAAMIEKQRRHGRQLQREQIMHDGCLSHKSGLGVGTLGLFARYLIRQTFMVQRTAAV